MLNGRKDSPKEASHDVLEKSDRLLLHQLSDHIAEDSAHRIEPLVCRANVCQANVVKKDLLNDEDGNSLAQLGPGLHNAKTQRDDLGRQEEVDHIRRIILHQCPDNAQRCETKVFEGARF